MRWYEPCKNLRAGSTANVKGLKKKRDWQTGVTAMQDGKNKEEHERISSRDRGLCKLF